MLCDTVTDLKSGLSVGTTKESRKLDAMVEYIKTGVAYGLDGESHVCEDLLEKRLSALDQVLNSKTASPAQKQAAVEAFQGVVKKDGVKFHGRTIRGLCSGLSKLELNLGEENKVLLAPIKREIGQQMLKADASTFLGGRSSPDTPDERLNFLKDYRGGPTEVSGISEGINEQIEILESAIREQKQKLEKLSGPLGRALIQADDGITKLNNAEFSKKFGAIQERAVAYAEQTEGREPVAGEAHDKFVMDMVSSLKELYQELLKELDSPGLERDGQREADVKAALNGLRNLAKNIVTTPPEAGSTLARREQAMVHVLINDELHNMGFARRDAVFLGSTRG